MTVKENDLRVRELIEEAARSYGGINGVLDALREFAADMAEQSEEVRGDDTRAAAWRDLARRLRSVQNNAALSVTCPLGK